MKTITHYQKTMWRLYCEYSYINSEVYYTRTFCCIDNCYRTMRSIRRSKEEWDFINSKYYYVTDIDPVFSGSKEDFINHLEKRTWMGKVLSGPSAFHSISYGEHWDRRGRNSGFKKQLHIEKKELSDKELNKRAWRKKVKDPRDQGSCHDSQSGWTCLQRRSNASERHKVKGMIHNCKDWDNWTNPTKRENLEPWDYY